MTTFHSPETFEPSAALNALDDLMQSADAPPVPSAMSAWDAAWIACMSNSAAWAAVAKREFSQVMSEMGTGCSLAIAR